MTYLSVTWSDVSTNKRRCRESDEPHRDSHGCTL